MLQRPLEMSALALNTGAGEPRPPLPFDEDDKPLVGGREIRDAVNRLLKTDRSLSAIFKQLGKGDIPANKTAGTWISSERKLRLHYARTTNGGDRAAA